jgi:hypothetical protein
MKRILLAGAAALALSASAGLAQSVADQIVAGLQAQGYTRIEVTEGPTQIKVEAIQGGTKLEYVYDRRTGAILKQEVEAVGPDDDTSPGVQVRRGDDALRGGDDDGPLHDVGDDDGMGDDDGPNHDIGDDHGGDRDDDGDDDDDDDDDRSGDDGSDDDDDDRSGDGGSDDDDDRSGSGNSGPGGDDDDDDDDGDRSGSGGGDDDGDDDRDGSRHGGDDD